MPLILMLILLLILFSVGGFVIGHLLWWVAVVLLAVLAWRLLSGTL